MGWRLLEKLPHGAQGRGPVLPPEVVPVVQVVEELVEQQALVKPRGLGDLAVVGSEEGPGEAPEHQGDRQFKLRMAIEGRGVIHNGPRVVLTHVSRPEIPVKKGRDDLCATKQIRNLHLRK